jgi:hypothetical protein
VRHVEYCGWIAWPLLLAGGAGIALGLIAVGLGIAKLRRFALAVAGASALLAVAAFAGGFVGRANGRTTVEEVLASVDPGVAPEIRAQGYLEAQSCVTVGIASALGPAIAATTGFVVAFLRKGPE